MVRPPLRTVLDTWFENQRKPVPADVPEPLRTLLSHVGAGLVCQNHLVVPGDDGVFYVENQSCHEWKIVRDGDPDPRVLRDDVFERERLSGFVLQIGLFEASMSGRAGLAGGAVDPDVLPSVLAPLVEVPLQPWAWPADPTRFFLGDGVVAHVTEDTWFFASACRPGALAWLADLAVDWDTLEDT